MASTVWKGHLTFGLLSLPVKLYSAARSESVGFNQLHKHDNSRVKNVLYCQAEDKPISRSEVVKGYEYEKDKYVVIDDEDIKKVAPKTAKTMEVLEFVKAEQVDAIFFESSYYMAPDEAGEKPYALLFEALRQSGCVGVAKSPCTIANTSLCCGPDQKAFCCTPCITLTRSGRWKSSAPIPAL